ncbi:MAG: flagellar basal body P-ring formation chaperone FlgA [Planctomycetota bacterium]|jgi:flagella basal body P-ring formation protein FlgA
MSGNKRAKVIRHKSIRIFIACLVMVPTLFCQASVNTKSNKLQTESRLKVYLPREVTIKDSNLTLGRVSILRGSEPLVAAAGKIAMGRISVPGQKIVIDRPMVLSRLACSGIPTSKVILTGSEKTTVIQQNQTISSREFVFLANSFLEKNPIGNSACRWNPIRKPKDFIVSAASKNITLSPRLVQTGAVNQARVEITVLSENKKIGVRQVTFALVYERRQTVTKADIPAGSVISPENVKTEKIQSNVPEPTNWKPPYGLIAKRRLSANTVLVPNMLESLKSPIIVKRNQNVVIRIERPGFLITAAGKTMQDGKAGEYIKVRNMDSQRIIMARISENGSVEPVL